MTLLETRTTSIFLNPYFESYIDKNNISPRSAENWYILMSQTGGMNIMIYYGLYQVILLVIPGSTQTSNVRNNTNHWTVWFFIIQLGCLDARHLVRITFLVWIFYIIMFRIFFTYRSVTLLRYYAICFCDLYWKKIGL